MRGISQKTLQSNELEDIGSGIRFQQKGKSVKSIVPD
jgi:hypothetical protein